jgi:hypothetical protein
MTEQIQGIASARVVDRRSTARERERLRRLYGRVGSHHDEEVKIDDQVDISEEARKRADGTYHKNILEHIEEDEYPGIR